MGRKVLVTGGAGYIGSMVTALLLEKGYHPVVFDTFMWGTTPLDRFRDKITIIKGDIRNSGDVIYALQDVDAVIHLAGLVGQPACAKNPSATYSVNVDSTHTLVNCMTASGLCSVDNLVYCSSCSVYGNVNGMYDSVNENTPTMPLSEYAYSKLEAEKIIFQKAATHPTFSPTIIRLTTIFGWSHRPRLDLVTNFFVYRALKEGKITVFGDGSQYRSLIHVADVANALVSTMEAPRYLRDRQIFHVGAEQNNVKIKELTDIVKAHIPKTTIEFLSQSDTDRRDYRISCNKIKNTLGWTAKYSVEDGIKELSEMLKTTELNTDSDNYRNNNYEYR